MDKKNANMIFPLLLIISLLSVLLLSIGYAQIIYDLDVEGDISLTSQQGVAIKNVEEVMRSSDVRYKIQNYVGTFLSTNLSFPNNQSSILFQIDFENNSQDYYQFTGIRYDSQNEFQSHSNPVIPTVLDKSSASFFSTEEDVLEIGEVLSPKTNNSLFLEYQYKTDEKIDDSYLEEMIHFVFKKGFPITYSGFDHDYSSFGFVDEEISISFLEDVSMLSIQNGEGKIYLEGVDYSFKDNQITIPSLKEAITIQKD